MCSEDLRQALIWTLWVNVEDIAYDGISTRAGNGFHGLEGMQSRLVNQIIRSVGKRQQILRAYSAQLKYSSRLLSRELLRSEP